MKLSVFNSMQNDLLFDISSTLTTTRLEWKHFEDSWRNIDDYYSPILKPDCNTVSKRSSELECH